jgi:hypothetical protein
MMNMILIAKLPNLEATPWINEVISLSDYHNQLDETCRIFGLSEVETYPCEEAVTLDLKAINKKAKAMAKELGIPARAVVKTDGSTENK